LTVPGRGRLSVLSLPQPLLCNVALYVIFVVSKCYLKEGPCGGVASNEPKTTLAAGSEFSVLFQQNVNHFYIDNPGKLVMDYAATSNPTEEDFSQLGEPVADYNAVGTLSNVPCLASTLTIV
jgi:hypothetical protein